MLGPFKTSVFVSISNSVFSKLISQIVVTVLSLYYVINLKWWAFIVLRGYFRKKGINVSTPCRALGWHCVLEERADSIVKWRIYDYIDAVLINNFSAMM